MISIKQKDIDMKILLAVANNKEDTTIRCEVDSDDISFYERMSPTLLSNFICSQDHIIERDVVQGEIREITSLIESDNNLSEDERKQEIEELFSIDILYHLFALDYDYRVIREI